MATVIEDIVGGGRGGFGFGGGGDGMGVLLGLLLGRGGLLGDNDRGRGDRDCITQADLNGKAIGDLKGEVKDVQAGLQLGLCEAESAINATTLAAANQLQNGQTAILLQAANQTERLLTAIAAVDTNVDRQACDIKTTILGALSANQIAELNQKLTVAQLDGLELRQRNDRDRERHSVEITMTNNQNQLQLQAQAQANAVNSLLGCVHVVAELVHLADHATPRPTLRRPGTPRQSMRRLRRRPPARR